MLVAGHSNTVPPLVAALCRCEVAPLADSDYDRIYILNMAEQGIATALRAGQGALRRTLSSGPSLRFGIL